jgi:flagellar hook assembly protein FlgD
MVRTLVDGRMNAGTHRIDWDGRNEENRYTGSGVYVVQMQAEDFIQYRKMMLIR